MSSMSLITQPDARPHKGTGTTRGPYSYKKCFRCRQDKKKCEPPMRQWPEKCTRCEDKNFECSDNQQTQNRAERRWKREIALAQRHSLVSPTADGESSNLTAKGMIPDLADAHSLRRKMHEYWNELVQTAGLQLDILRHGTHDQDDGWLEDQYQIFSPTTLFLSERLRSILLSCKERSASKKLGALFARSYVESGYSRNRLNEESFRKLFQQQIESGPFEPFARDTVDAFQQRNEYFCAIPLQKCLVREVASQFGTDSVQLTGCILKYVDLMREVTDLSNRVFESPTKDDDDIQLIAETGRMAPFLHDCLFLCGPGSPTAPQTILQIAHNLDLEDFIGPDLLGSTLLHVACGSYYWDAVGILISLEVSVNATDMFGRTALHSLVLGRNVRHICMSPYDRPSSAERTLAKKKTLAVLLTSEELNVDVIDDFGKTALDYALDEDPPLFHLIDSSPPGALARQRKDEAREAELDLPWELDSESPPP